MTATLPTATSTFTVRRPYVWGKHDIKHLVGKCEEALKSSPCLNELSDTTREHLETGTPAQRQQALWTLQTFETELSRLAALSDPLTLCLTQEQQFDLGTELISNTSSSKRKLVIAALKALEEIYKLDRQRLAALEEYDYIVVNFPSQTSVLHEDMTPDNIGAIRQAIRFCKNLEVKTERDADTRSAQPTSNRSKGKRAAKARRQRDAA